MEKKLFWKKKVIKVCSLTKVFGFYLSHFITVVLLIAGSMKKGHGLHNESYNDVFCEIRSIDYRQIAVKGTFILR